jgi:hypothetical protein
MAGMKTQTRVEVDRIGAYASAICAVHCLVTGVALGLLSFAGLGFLGSVAADVAFLSVAVLIATVAIVHGIRKHHSYKPALIFVAGLLSVILGHFVFRHDHPGGTEGPAIWSTVFSVVGGLCFVLFHVVNLRLQRACGCGHCAKGE